jgi:hypothetical protein
MTRKRLVMALSIAFAASPVLASIPDGVPMPPAGSPQTQYCLRMEPIIGSRIATIRCATRDEWAQLDVDLDQEWAENGVRVIG